MKKQVTVKIAVQEPTISYEKDTHWQKLEHLAGNCPVPYSSTGYSIKTPVRDYHYHNVTTEEAELIRVYWTETELEVDEIREVEIWDSEEDYPVLEGDKIKVREME